MMNFKVALDPPFSVSPLKIVYISTVGSWSLGTLNRPESFENERSINRVIKGVDFVLPMDGRQ